MLWLLSGHFTSFFVAAFSNPHNEQGGATWDPDMALRSGKRYLGHSGTGRKLPRNFVCHVVGVVLRAFLGGVHFPV